MSDSPSNETIEMDEQITELTPVMASSKKATIMSAVDIEANGTNGNVTDSNGKAPVIDPIQSAMGLCGKWHIIILGLIFLLKFPVAWHQMSIIFLGPNIEFRCSDNITDKCSPNCSSHIFDHSIFSETIQTTWDLVCNQAHLANASQTIFMFGILVGNILFGALADKHGRRSPLIAAVIIQLVTGVATAFTPWFWLFCFLRFLTALATGGTMVTSFVLVMEIIGTKYRELASVLYQIPFSLGHLSLPLFAYYLRDWHELQFALSIPSLVLISYYWMVPESPRWLFTTGQIDKSIIILEQAAKRNKLPVEPIRTNLEKLAASTHSDKPISRGNVIDLFRTPNMRIKTIAICFNWFVCGLSFFGVAQFIGQSAGNIFANVAISAAVSIPGTLACIYTMKRFGRRMTLFSSNLLCGICMLLVAVFPKAQVPLATAGIIGMSVSFPTAYLYGGEIFPTVVRNVGVGLASMVARIGSMIAPFLLSVKVLSPIYPPIVLGVIPIVGALFVLLLPETCGQPLPATLDDGEAFGKKKSTKS